MTENWKDADGKIVLNSFVIEEIKDYTSLGGTVYVGTDSMLHSHKCNFTAVIAFHNREHDIARYYYRNIKKPSRSYRDLQKKILEEVELAIKTAQFVTEVCPDSDVQVHVDVGTKKKNETSKFLSIIQGWVTGTGYDLKVKPESWASSIADSHTKRMRG